jgi:hypothetical protein
LVRFDPASRYGIIKSAISPRRPDESVENSFGDKIGRAAHRGPIQTLNKFLLNATVANCRRKSDCTDLYLTKIERSYYRVAVCFTLQCVCLCLRMRSEYLSRICQFTHTKISPSDCKENTVPADGDTVRTRRRKNPDDQHRD